MGITPGHRYCTQGGPQPSVSGGRSQWWLSLHNYNLTSCLQTKDVDRELRRTRLCLIECVVNLPSIGSCLLAHCILLNIRYPVQFELFLYHSVLYLPKFRNVAVRFPTPHYRYCNQYRCRKDATIVRQQRNLVAERCRSFLS